MASHDVIPREVLPIPDRKPVSLTTYDAKDPDTKFPPIEPLLPPEGAPNVLIVLLDDVGYGAGSPFGGPANGNLLPSTLYTVVITGGQCTPTAAGIRVQTPCAALATTSWTFTTEIANPAPTVTATNPVANATNVIRRGPPVITATFSEPVQGVNATTATIARTGGGAIAATVVYNAATQTVSITPAANLRANTSFTVTLRGGATAIRDLTNKPLVTKTWSFTTGA